jgi:hypothetical protein
MGGAGLFGTGVGCSSFFEHEIAINPVINDSIWIRILPPDLNRIAFGIVMLHPT